MAEARFRLSKEHFAGRVVEWKGTYGWIESLEPIDHPDISKHHGRIFVHQDDLTKPTAADGSAQAKGEAKGEAAKDGGGPPKPRVLRKGVICEFDLYQDSQGLGAENVITRQVVRLLLPIPEGKRIFSQNGEKVPEFEDRHNVSLRAFEWYNVDGSPGMLPFLVEVWGRPSAIVSAVTELKNAMPETVNLDFLIPQSRVWLLDIGKLHKLSGCQFQISNLTAIDDPMPCYPLTCNGTDEELGKAVLALIDQICDPS